MVLYRVCRPIDISRPILIRQGAAVSRSSQYVLREVTVGEAGVYQCTADNGVDRPAQRHVNVSVLCQ